MEYLGSSLVNYPSPSVAEHIYNTSIKKYVIKNYKTVEGLTKREIESLGLVYIDNKRYYPKGLISLMKKYSIQPNSLLDRVWVNISSKNITSLKYKQYSLYRREYSINHLNVIPYNKEQYWEMLETETDPIRFIQYLTRWPAFNVRLVNVPYGMGENNLNVPSFQLINNEYIIYDTDLKDIEHYQFFIKTFYEKILWKFVKEAFIIRQLLSTYDVDTITNIFSFVINNLLLQGKYIDEEPNIAVYVDGKVAYNLIGGIPNFYSVNWAGKTYKLREAIKAQYDYALNLVRFAAEVLGAHAVSLKDKYEKLRLSPYANDPAFNLFLIWAGKDVEKGTVYKEVGHTLTRGWEERKAQDIIVPYGPKTVHYEYVPILTEYVYRHKGKPSMYDIDREKERESVKLGTILTIAGGVAAAALAARYM